MTSGWGTITHSAVECIRDMVWRRWLLVGDAYFLQNSPSRIVWWRVRIWKPLRDPGMSSVFQTTYGRTQDVE